jgi:hypothetical protein
VISVSLDVLEILGIKPNKFGDIETLLLKNINETMGLLGVEPLNSETDD